METRISFTTLETGERQITITGNLPSPSIAENPKYHYTPWNVKYQQEQLEKDGERILQSLANAEFVELTVDGRKGTRESERATKKRDKLAADLAAAQARVAELQSASA